MANRDLLKEAIADAKAVKEVAIANAKAALEEAFTPHLKNMLTQKINEMDDNSDQDEEKEIEEVETGGKDEELDLDELLAELELDDDSEESEEETTDLDGEDLGDDEEIDLDEMSEDELKTMIEDVIGDMVESGELEAGGDTVEMSDEETEEDEDVDVDVEVGEEEVDEEELQEIGGAIDPGAEPKAFLKKKPDYTNLEENLKKDLKEAKKVIKYLRSEINEVNLLNSKLLYTNKIFKAKNLNENQKIKVLKAFDKAETVKEAKRIFETLNENLVAKSTKSNIRESMGAASKPAGMAPTRKSTNIIPEDAMVNRFKQLAGIK
jgi:hypothetical protein